MSVVSNPTEATCYFCDLPGAESVAGIGQVAGVAVHFECWMRNNDPRVPGEET